MIRLRLKDLPKEERPRERVKQYGVEALSNVELLQILLQSGTQGKDVKVLSEEVLLYLMREEIPTLEELKQIRGLGEAKALSILATMELGKRIFLSPEKRKERITTARAAYHYMHHFFYGKKQECFYCLYLDYQNYPICSKLLFQGTSNKSTVHPREIFKEAYRSGAYGIICFHNHPSGFVEPSEEDRKFTKKLVEIGRLQNLPILDHIIIGNQRYYSFKENFEI